MTSPTVYRDVELEQISWPVFPVFVDEHDDTTLNDVDESVDNELHSWALLQLYGSNNSSVTSQQVSELRTLPERLAEILLSVGRSSDRIIASLDHESVAEELGTEEATISAIMRSFHRQQFIRIGYRQTAILDEEALEELAFF